jgi:hypothetical protein
MTQTVNLQMQLVARPKGLNHCEDNVRAGVARLRKSHEKRLD